VVYSITAALAGHRPTYLGDKLWDAVQVEGGEEEIAVPKISLSIVKRQLLKRRDPVSGKTARLRGGASRLQTMRALLCII